MQGHMPGTLSRAGIKQGEKLANRLKDEKIDAIFSSDLKRAVDTTDLIAKFHPNIKIEFTQKLREGSAGAWTGVPSHGLDWDNRPADSETEAQMMARTKEFLDFLCENYTNKTVLSVTHAGIARCFVATITGAKDPFKDVGDQHNTAVNIFEVFEDDTHKIHCLNCIKHLK